MYEHSINKEESKGVNNRNVGMVKGIVKIVKAWEIEEEGE